MLMMRTLEGNGIRFYTKIQWKKTKLFGKNLSNWFVLKGKGTVILPPYIESLDLDHLEDVEILNLKEITIGTLNISSCYSDSFDFSTITVTKKIDINCGKITLPPVNPHVVLNNYLTITNLHEVQIDQLEIVSSTNVQHWHPFN